MRKSSTVRIYIADDDPDDRLLINDAFLESGAPLDLTFFENGDSIIEGLTSGRPETLPQLIMLDLNMPGKGGREAIADIKAEPSLRGIPVIILTTSSDEDDIAACYDLGASSYIVKPASYEELVDITRSLTDYWTRTNVLPGP